MYIGPASVCVTCFFLTPKVLNAPLDPANYEDEPLDNGLDFGGGNVVLAYALTEHANLRVAMRVEGSELTNVVINLLPFLP